MVFDWQSSLLEVGLILLAYYPITRARAEETQRILNERRNPVEAA